MTKYTNSIIVIQKNGSIEPLNYENLLKAYSLSLHLEKSYKQITTFCPKFSFLFPSILIEFSFITSYKILSKVSKFISSTILENS